MWIKFTFILILEFFKENNHNVGFLKIIIVYFTLLPAVFSSDPKY